MRARDLWIVARREYLTRLRSKGFWISTLLLPLLMAAWVFIPGLVMSKSQAKLRLAVVDESGHFLEALTERLATREREAAAVRFEVTPVEPRPDAAALRAELDVRVLEGELDAWLWVPDDALESDTVEYHGQNVSNFITQEALEGALSAVAREQRLSAAGYDVTTIRQLSRDIQLATVRLSEEGSRAEGGFGALALGIGLFIVLYMTLIIYGNQVMQGVLEEKTSRVVEVLVSTLRPVELLAGKLAGICGAALTQLGIWMATAVVLTAPGLVATVASLPEGFQLPTIAPAVVVHSVLHFLLGFVLYASLFAMLGAAFNDAQEAQQLTVVVIVFLVAPWMIFLPVANDPNSTLAVVTSLIPLFTPLIMTLRIAIQMPPWWQIALGYGLSLLACGAAIWLSARIYRVGILMYGKKPTLRELARWVRYA